MEEQVLAHDLHIAQLGEGQPHQNALGAHRQSILRVLLPLVQSVQQREQQLGADRLEQVFQRPHAVALVGEARRGGQEHDVRCVIEAADLTGGFHAGHAGHEHVQQVQRKALPLGGVQQLSGAAEGAEPDGGAAVGLPRLQKSHDLFQLLDLIVTYSDIHGSPSCACLADHARVFYHRKPDLSAAILHFAGANAHFRNGSAHFSAHLL